MPMTASGQLHFLAHESEQQRARTRICVSHQESVLGFMKSGHTDAPGHSCRPERDTTASSLFVMQHSSCHELGTHAESRSLAKMSL